MERRKERKKAERESFELLASGCPWRQVVSRWWVTSGCPASELSGSLMADRKLVEEIHVPNATAEHGVAVALIKEYVWLIEKRDEDQLQFHLHFATKHTMGIMFVKWE